MNKSHKKCAFCFQENKMTKEHIWPEGIVRRLPTYTARFFEKADKVMNCDHTIKDVCVKCNNGALSGLDAYGCMLFDKYFHALVEPESEVRIEYDYDRLLRWLTKISYNTARSCANPSLSLLKPLTTYILGQAGRPHGVELYLDIVTDSILYTMNGPKIFPAAAFRSGRVVGDPPLPDWCNVRLVALNSFYFYILVFKESYYANEDLAKVRQRIKGVFVPPNSNNLGLPHSLTGAFEVHGDHMLSNLDKYRKFFRTSG